MHLLLVLLAFFSSIATLTRSETVAMPMVGGYTEIENVESHDRLPAVKEYVFAKIAESPYSFASLVTSSPQGKDLQIIQAWSQVVAGMNYRLLMILMDADTQPLGAFTVTVYDQFGTLSDVTWGDELTIDQANDLWKKKQGEST